MSDVPPNTAPQVQPAPDSYSYALNFFLVLVVVAITGVALMIWMHKPDTRTIDQRIKDACEETYGRSGQFVQKCRDEMTERYLHDAVRQQNERTYNRITR